MTDLFRFEVPTSKGHFVIIGPDDVPMEEAERIGEKIARLLPLFMVMVDSDVTSATFEGELRAVGVDPVVLP